MRITSESKTGYFTSISVTCVFLFVQTRVWCSYKLTESAVVSAIVQIDGVFLMFRLQELKAEGQSATSTTVSTPQPVNNIVHYLAQALAHIEQGIERKFLKAPLGKICYFYGFFWNVEGIKPSFHYLRKAKDRKALISNVEWCGSCVELQSYAYTEISDPIWASDALKYLNRVGPLNWMWCILIKTMSTRLELPIFFHLNVILYTPFL